MVGREPDHHTLIVRKTIGRVIISSEEEYEKLCLKNSS